MSGHEFQRQKLILLIEDDQGVREAVHEILEGEGYAVMLADNGRDALERLRSGSSPDLIVLDLRMPVMDGWEFRAAQRSDPNLAAIPVLAVSADGSAKAEAIAADGYLRKPLSTSTLVDTIRRILAHSERQRHLGRLEEAEQVAALGRLAAGVGHEINNPLAYASANVDLVREELSLLLIEQSELDAPRRAVLSQLQLTDLREMLDESRDGLRRIRDVVRNLQSLCGLEKSKREPFSLNEVLDESLAMVGNQVEYRARIVKEYGVLPPVVGNRSAIGQVFLSLLLNAAQALPDGHPEDNEIALKTCARQDDLAIEIRDTGIGIPPDVLPHIFERFYTTKAIEDGKGTGLGLAVSHRIVTDHGGRILVDSELGRGSTIRVVLPRHPDV